MLVRLIYPIAIMATVYVKRDLEERFLRVSENFPITALVGPRQAGKTTMLRNLMKGFDANYVSFDDPDARELFGEDIKKFMIQYMKGYELVVLDEVQYCKNAGINLKFLADTGFRMWISSSSEILLGRDVLSYLVGRVAVERLYPFNIFEFLRAKGQKVVSDRILRRHEWEHMVYGGFPASVMAGDVEIKKEILRNLHETMLFKDVARNFSIDNIASLERLSRYLALNSGAIIAYSKLADDLKMSFQSLRKYMDALSKSYLIMDVPPYFTNKSREISKQPKIYLLDTGLRNSVSGTYPSEPNGRLFENYVLSELTKMGFIPRFWRSKGGAEVDFIIERNGSLVPIEVKLRAEHGKIERSMRSFIGKYGPELAVVVGYEVEKGDMKINGTEVAFTDILGLWKLLSS